MLQTRSLTFLADYILKQSLDLICTIDYEGRFTYVSDACERLLGFNPDFLVNKFSADFIHPLDHKKTHEARSLIFSGMATSSFENRMLSKRGEEVYFSWSAVLSENENEIICIGRDITEQVLAKNKVQIQQDLFQALIEHGSDMLALLDVDGTFKYAGGSTYRILGYEPNQLIGVNALSMVHPDDLPTVQSALVKLVMEGGEVTVPAFRFKDNSENWIWLEATGSNQLSNESIGSLVVNSRDITQSTLYQQKLKENEQRFNALFDNNPDLVFLESKNGTILDVNPAVLDYFKISENEIKGRHLIEFLPSVSAELCTQKRHEAIAGNKVQFELESQIIGNTGTHPVILDMTKIPVEINGEIVGLYTIARDVTALRESHKTIKTQAKRLSNIFESITDAFFTIDNNWNFVYINNECERVLNINREQNIGRNILKIFPEEVNGLFHQKYKYAFATGNSVHFEAYMDRLGRWLEVKAFPYQDGLSVYFADITERRQIEEQLEKLSIVASKTSNGVVILDNLGFTEWVNEGFTRITGYTLPEIKGKKPRELLHGPETNQEVANKMYTGMSGDKPFTTEILNYTKTGEEIWLSLNLTPVKDDAGIILNYVVILTDITDMIINRQKMKELSLVASTSTNGIFITDAEHRIEWINEGFTRLTGYTIEDAYGRRPSELLQNGKETSESFTLAKEMIMRAEPVAFDVQYSTKNMEDIWVSAEINPVQDEQGKLTRFIATLTDITALKKSELELTQLTTDLYRHNRDMQQFTYIVSHNLRSPVANAVGLTQLLNKLDKHSPAFDKGLFNLNKSVSQLDLMIKDLNTILSIKDVKEDFTQEKVELHQVMQQVAASLQEPLENCGGSLTLDLPEHFTISGNKAYLHSIFYNLISNAIKYKSPERNLEVLVTGRLQASGETVLTITDNGSGFDMEKVGSKLFKIYNRFHTEVADGRGIGLFLVKTHLEALGGRIEVNSEVNSGTTFTIYLK